MTDALCYFDLDLNGRELDDPLAELEQDLVHRLIERPSSNLDDLDRGVGLDDMLSGPIDQKLARRIEDDFAKDERVSAVSATVTPVEAGSYRIEIQVVANESKLGIVLVADGAGNVRRAA